MKLDICIPVLNQEESTQKTLDSLKRLQKFDNRYIIIDNGSTRFVRDWLKGLSGDDIVIRNPQNVGLPKALNQALQISNADYVFNTHSDIEMFEQDWDLKTIQAIEEANKIQTVGVAGYFGAMGIGRWDIYKNPYEMYQLVRTNPVAGNRCKLDPAIHHHMQFNSNWQKCAVLDGFSLIVKNDGVLKFWSESVHHMYDNDICLASYNLGMQVITINMDVIHYGGRTDVGEDWASPFGKTKQEIHSEAHLPFYNKWAPNKQNITLPFNV